MPPYIREIAASLAAAENEPNDRGGSPIASWVRSVNATFATFFGEHDHAAGESAWADALSRIATATGNPRGALGTRTRSGEIALLEGDATQAATHFGQALDLLNEV